MRNLKNAAVALLVPLPSILFYLHFIDRYTASKNHAKHWLWKWCFDHPLLLANVLFFVNIDVLFWIIGRIQSSNWMIDLYWTVIPLLLFYYHAAFPFSQYNWWRSLIVMAATWMWSLRLTHNYFRRENWQWGAREDWRFADLRVQYGKQWWWISFFSVYLSQQVFLMGICLPFYVIHTVDKELNFWDILGIGASVVGVIIAYVADTELYKFVSKSGALKGEDEVILEKGLWYYSRHPNYFGEQLFWWGLGLVSWNLGHAWAVVGALVNSLCLVYVTMLVEKRILTQKNREKHYRLYQMTTSVWIPWFKSSVKKDL